MANEMSKFCAYGVFDKVTKERVAYIKATRKVDDFKVGECILYFGNTPIGKVSLKNHIVRELV